MIEKTIVGKFNGEDVYLFTGIPGQETLWCKGQKGYTSAFTPIIRQETTECMFNSECKIIDQGNLISVGCLTDTKDQFNKLVQIVKQTIKKHGKS